MNISKTFNIEKYVQNTTIRHLKTTYPNLHMGIQANYNFYFAYRPNISIFTGYYYFILGIFANLWYIVLRDNDNNQTTRP